MPRRRDDQTIAVDVLTPDLYFSPVISCVQAVAPGLLPRALLLATCMAACTPAVDRPAEVPATTPPPVEEMPASEPPVLAEAPDPRDQALLGVCGPGEVHLHEAAAMVVAATLAGRAAPSAIELGEMLRAAGDAHVHARAWTATAQGLDRSAAARRLNAWIGTARPVGRIRCGIASGVNSERGEVVAVVRQDVLADLRTQVASRVRPFAWVAIDAVSLVQALGAQVIVLGPRGAPRTITTSYDPATRQIVARFNADTEGPWVAQVVAATERGPMPVIEVRLMAGMQARAPFVAGAAPGEDVAPGTDDGETLLLMLNAARLAERLAPLERDAGLDQVAREHVGRMMTAGVIGHDVGDGLPPERVAAAGLDRRNVGENVAKAASAGLAHRALWWSLSHRTNLLHAGYTTVGVAAERDAAGAVWVAEVFAE